MSLAVNRFEIVNPDIFGNLLDPNPYHRGKFYLSHSEVEFLVILCKVYFPEVLSPEADLRPRPSLHTHNRDREKSSGQANAV
jgi:hypothetical protein